MITILVMSSDKTSHLLKGFFHQWQKYWVRGLGERYIVVTQSAVDTPAGWFQYRANKDSQLDNWASHLGSALAWLEPTPILLLMDDYWLCEPVKGMDVDKAFHKVSGGLFDKIDLTGDRFGFTHTDYDDDYIISDPQAEYLASTQAAVWDYWMLNDLAVLHCEWNPWQFELEGTKVLQERERPVQILGAKSRPVQYANVSLRGQKALRLDRLTPEDKRELLMVGAISKEDFFDEG